MAWLAKFAAASWAKLAILAGVVAAVAIFLARVFKAGGDQERAKSAKAAHDHQAKTGDQVSRSDEAVADPKSPRAQRVRKQFERDDDDARQ